jgi:WD40 repeat protein
MNAATPVAVTRPASPYPGLRPFEPEEWSIFFGRETMIDEVIDRLAQNRLVLIHGVSGSGKSSLVRGGVLPKLALQHFRRDAPWLTCYMRPSGGPLWNLAAEFARLEGHPGDIERIGATAGQFNARAASLASVAASLEGVRGKSLCVLVDQFEELFRFEKEMGRDEAELFVELIQRAATEDRSETAPGVDLHVIVTMRSEFLGECARFTGFAETINRTQYLVPRMDDDELMRAVQRPAQMFGGVIAPALAKRLVASVRGREDELPLLQHGLALMWDDAIRRVQPNAPLTVDGSVVDEAGGLANLLSNHADAVMASIAPDDRKKSIVEAVFRALTDVNAEGSAIRRPCEFIKLCAVADATPEELRPILDAFRSPGVSFLTPYAPEPIGEKRPIDISHEALIRCWRSIGPGADAWLLREFRDGLFWRTLLFQAENFADDGTSYLSEAATEARALWLAERNEAWSERYGSGWPKVVTLIEASREHWKRQREAVLLDQKRIALAEEQRKAAAAQKRLARVALVGGMVAALVAAVAVWQYLKADLTRKEALVQRDRAVKAETAANAAKEDAFIQREAAVRAEDDADRARAEAQAYAELAKANLRGARVTQSRFLADLARQRRAAGDAGTALVLSLEALPHGTDEVDRPYVPEAELQLDSAWRGLRERLVLGHQAGVTNASFSPDGRRIVTASDDKTARIWDAVTGKPIGAPLKGHTGDVLSAAFSPDGRRIVTASDDKTARIWDAASGNEIVSLIGHSGAVTDAAFSSDGKHVITASADKFARVWDASTGKQIGMPLKGHEDPLSGAAFSPDGRRIVTASLDQTARVWDAVTGQQIATIRGHDDAVTSAAFSPDGKRIVTASYDKTARVWDAATGKQIGIPLKVSDRVFSAAFSPDGKHIITASADNTARIWDALTGEEIAELGGHNDPVVTATFSPNGQRIVTASLDKTARVWDAATGKPIGEPLIGHVSSVTSAAFSPDGKRIRPRAFGTPQLGRQLGNRSEGIAEMFWTPPLARMESALSQRPWTRPPESGMPGPGRRLAS